jgi:hypothetical protein
VNQIAVLDTKNEPSNVALKLPAWYFDSEDLMLQQSSLGWICFLTHHVDYEESVTQYDQGTEDASSDGQFCVNGIVVDIGSNGTLMASTW